MDSELFSLCKSIILWWNKKKNENEKEPMPDFVRQAIGIMGDAIMNMDESELEE